MIHRIGALVVGLILIGSFIKMDNNTTSNSSSAMFLNSLKLTTILWFANLFVGAAYIIQAKVGDFPEWISLLHLLIGVSTFLAAMWGPMMFRLSHSNLQSEMSSEFMESSPETNATNKPSLLKICIQLMKLRVIILLQITAICAILVHDLLARHGLINVDRTWTDTFYACVITVVGGTLSAGGSNAINMWYDADD